MQKAIISVAYHSSKSSTEQLAEVLAEQVKGLAVSDSITMPPGIITTHTLNGASQLDTHFFKTGRREKLFMNNSFTQTNTLKYETFIF